MDEINITELYGACILLKSIIESTRETIAKNDVPVPGQYYLLKRFDELYKDVNVEIFNRISGTLTNLQKAIEDADHDS